MAKKKRDEVAAPPAAPLLSPASWLFLIAVAVRLAHFFLYKGDFWHDTPLLDDNLFVSWRGVIQKEGFLASSLGTFDLNPGYPYFLAYAGRLLGDGVLPVILLQHLLGALAPVLLYRIGEQLFDGRVGFVAGLLGAFYGPAVFFESRLLGESFIYLLNIAALWMLARAPASAPESRALLAGVFLGLSAVFRPTVLAFVPFAALWLFATASSPLLSWLCALLLGLGTWLPMLPFQLRNRAVDPSAGWGLTTASGGVNLFLGNNPEADGLNKPPSFVHYGPGMQYRDFKEEAEAREGKKLSAREVSSYWTRRTLKWFQERPAAAWSLVGRKALLFWNHREPPDNFFQALFERFTKLREAPLADWGLVSALGLLGLLASLPWLGTAWLLHAYALTYLGLCAAFYVLARYRFPAAAGLIPLAAFALVRFWDYARGLGRLKALGLALLLLPCLWLTRLPLIGEEDPASSHYSMAVVYANQGWKDKAVEEYR
ncbi:MAG TPA: hypothetical protein DCM05_09810, partial [Elusimicrobia bacterium]|nr:hypothetical protein [Elusimicrobiota bacterium]